jgi:hypothetical protein
MKASLLAIALMALLGVSFGCATMKSEGVATLHLTCNVPDALVLVDDTLVGKAADFAKADKSIRPGFSRIEVRQAGYYSYFTEITVPEGGVASVKAELHPLLD